MLDAARCIVYRDLLLALRRRSDVATALLFFVIVASLFPLGVGAEPNLLRSIAPGVIWVAALLSSMLSLGRLFAADHADGTLEQMLLGTPVLSLIGAIGAALTLGLRGGGVLVALLVLPLYVPVLILGAGSVEMAAAGLAADAQLLLLGALLVVAAAFAPWAVAAALRISIE